MITDDIRRAAERRLAELEAEAIHLRALVRLYGGSDSAARAIEPATATIARANRGARIIAPEWQPLGRFMASRRGDVHLDDLEACAKRLDMPFNRDRIRQQMHNWKNGKLVITPAQ